MGVFGNGLQIGFVVKHFGVGHFDFLSVLAKVNVCHADGLVIGIL
jgi:hypothetical protein